MAKKIKIGGTYFNPETGMLESSSGTGFGVRASAIIQKIRDFFRGLFPRRSTSSFYRRSYFDRFKYWLLDILEHFVENIFPSLIWIVPLFIIIATWLTKGFIIALIVGVVSVVLTPLVGGIMIGIMNLILSFLEKILSSKTSFIITIIVFVGCYVMFGGKTDGVWSKIYQPTSRTSPTQMEYVAYSDITNIRSTPSSKSQNNIIGSIPYGQRIQQSGYSETEWMKINYNGSEAYIHSDLIISSDDYEMLNGIMQSNYVKTIDLAKYRKVLIEYYKKYNYKPSSTNKSSVWNIAQCVSGKNIATQRLNVGNTYIDVFGVIIENVALQKKKLIAFTFNTDNTLQKTYEWNVIDKKGINKFYLKDKRLEVSFQNIPSANTNQNSASQQTKKVDVYKGYVGERNAEGQPHGFGLYTLSNGDKFEATWVNGVATGHGTYTSHKGWEYIGSIEDSKFHGIGTMYYKDGTHETSQWEKDKKVKTLK